MLNRWLLGVCLLCLSSAVCAGDPVPLVLDEAVQAQASAAWRARRLEAGKQVYEHACASCHDEGVHGAPAIGDRDAWKDRSPLWSAVLFEHSRDGYLEMPAKGAHEDLSDLEVDAAGEYLLSKTFPELPLD